MHMSIEKEKCLSLLHSPYITPYSIKSIDNEALHEEELEKNSCFSQWTHSPFRWKKLQQYRIRCHKNGNIAAFTIKNFTKDQLFLTEYLQNKLHSFNELIYFPKNQGFYRILKQKQVVFDTTFQKWEGNNENKRSYHTDAPCCFRRLYIFGISRFRF